jgi:hypothetical protein
LSESPSATSFCDSGLGGRRRAVGEAFEFDHDLARRRHRPDFALHPRRRGGVGRLVEEPVRRGADRARGGARAGAPNRLSRALHDRDLGAGKDLPRPGDLTAAESEAEELHTPGGDPSQRSGMPLGPDVLGQIALHRGDLARAAEHLDYPDEIAQPGVWGWAVNRGRRGLLRAAQGRLEEAPTTC